jgi:hypothetical protein
MVRSSSLRTGAVSFPIINNTSDIMLDAFVDLHRDSDNTFTDKFLQVSSKNVIVGFESIDFENRVCFRRGLEETLSLFVLVLVVKIRGDALVLGIVECIDLFSSQTAYVGEEIAIDKLLFRETGDEIRSRNLVVPCIQILQCCNC